MSNEPALELVPVDTAGKLPDGEPAISSFVTELAPNYVPFYERVGFIEPWTGYFAREGESWVGSCGFKGPPRDGRVEIAYVTDPTHRGRGVATAMAKAMLSIAKNNDPRIQVFAQTVAEENASTSILKKLGFEKTRVIEDPEDGTLWEWDLKG